jgi:SAM-dependent methyltransferase
MTMPDWSDPIAQGLSISEESVQEHAENYPGAYDIVCSFQVLEHVVDPRGFLEASVKLLAPGGKLIISTPNARSFLRHAFNILDMPPHHMTGWSVESYRFLQSILPVKLERVLYEPLADYHIDYFVDTYSSRFDGRFDILGAWARGACGGVSKRLLRAGGRRLFRGQSMLAIFKKLDN